MFVYFTFAKAVINCDLFEATCCHAECHYGDCRGANLAPDSALKQNISDFIPKATYELLMICKTFNLENFSQ
jgi:hypothetical protein